VVLVGAVARRRPVRLGFGLGVLLVVTEEGVEQVLVEAGGVERVAPAPVRQREPGGDADVVTRHVGATLPCGMGARGAGRDEVGAHPVDVEAGADGSNLGQRPLAQSDEG